MTVKIAVTRFFVSTEDGETNVAITYTLSGTDEALPMLSHMCLEEAWKSSQTLPFPVREMTNEEANLYMQGEDKLTQQQRAVLEELDGDEDHHFTDLPGDDVDTDEDRKAERECEAVLKAADTLGDVPEEELTKLTDARATDEE